MNADELNTGLLITALGMGTLFGLCTIFLHSCRVALKRAQQYKACQITYYTKGMRAAEQSMEMLQRNNLSDSVDMKGQRMYYDLCKFKLEAIQSFPV